MILGRVDAPLRVLPGCLVVAYFAGSTWWARTSHDFSQAVRDSYLIELSCSLYVLRRLTLVEFNTPVFVQGEHQGDAANFCCAGWAISRRL